MSDKDIERLCAGYRSSVEDPPYDAADAALLHAATLRARGLPKRRLVYSIAATLLAALGLAAGLWLKTPWRRLSNVDTRQTAALREEPHPKRQDPLFDQYLTNATLGSAHAGRLDYAEATPLTRASRAIRMRQRDTESLREAYAVAAMRAELACGPSAEVDLNAPGVLGSLKSKKPADYARIMGIITGLMQHPELDVVPWISATFHARGVSYLPLWLTSLPPKRLLSFCLGSTRYRVVLTIARDGARVSPESTRGGPARQKSCRRASVGGAVKAADDARRFRSEIPPWPSSPPPAAPMSRGDRNPG